MRAAKAPEDLERLQRLERLERLGGQERTGRISPASSGSAIRSQLTYVFRFCMKKPDWSEKKSNANTSSTSKHIEIVR